LGKAASSALGDRASEAGFQSTGKATSAPKMASQLTAKKQQGQHIRPDFLNKHC
jgi:hypothetical protein